MDDITQQEKGQGDENSKANRLLGRDEQNLPREKNSQTLLAEGASTSQNTVATSPSTDTSDSEDEPTDMETSYETLDEWKDVQPVPLAVGSVMPIAFTPRFQNVFGYFRGILAIGELSPRGLRLCEDAARLNPANYAVWMYRRKVLAHLGSDLTVELQYISRVIERNPKNYQVWYHRQKIVEILKDFSKEFDFTAKMLKKDEKNYHVWQYRQFIFRHFDGLIGLQHEELKFVESFVRKDPFNNSAWMQRFFVLDELPRACGRKSLLDSPSVLAEEVQYTLSQLAEQAHNESPWSYLRGILRDRWADQLTTVHAFCVGLYSQNFRSPFLLSFMLDMFEEGISQNFFAKTFEEKTVVVKKMLRICSELEETHDRIRSAYWQWSFEQYKQKFQHFLV